jgi:hypothetical protein
MLAGRFGHSYCPGVPLKWALRIFTPEMSNNVNEMLVFTQAPGFLCKTIPESAQLNFQMAEPGLPFSTILDNPPIVAK